MADKSPGEQSAAASAVNERLLQLLEQVVANQAVQATANLQDEFAERLRAAVQYRDSRDHAVSPLGYDQLQTGLRFVANKPVELRMVDTVCDETVRRVLKKTRSSRG